MKTQSDERGTAADSRRAFLKKATVVGGVMWATAVVSSTLTPAAAASATTSLFKLGNNNSLPDCLNGSSSPADRGDVTLSRTSSTSLDVSITLQTGTSIAGRVVAVLQSTGPSGSCFDCNAINTTGNNSPCPSPDPPCYCTGTTMYTWTASDDTNGGASFTFTSLNPSATHFVVIIPKSGGGGNDTYSTVVVYLP